MIVINMSSIYSPRYKELLKNLISARKKAGLIQLAVAKKLKKPQSYISKIESGERKIEFTEVEDLSKIYNMPLSHFETTELKRKNEN